MTIIHCCNRCGFKASAKSEHRAEMLFTQHICKTSEGKPMRDLNSLSNELVEKLARGLITEEQAFALTH